MGYNQFNHNCTMYEYFPFKQTAYGAPLTDQCHEKTNNVVLNRSDTNQSVQSKKTAGSLIDILDLESRGIVLSM